MSSGFWTTAGGPGCRTLSPGSCAEAGAATRAASRRISFRIGSVHRSRPVWIGSILGNGHLPRRAAVQIHAIDSGTTGAIGALENDLAAARRPARPFVGRPRRQLLL